MRSNLEVIVQWEIDAINRLVSEGHDYFARRATEEPASDDDWLKPDGSLSDGDVLRRCQEIVLEAAVHQLNNLVDGILLALADRSSEDAEPSATAQRQRATKASLEAVIQTRSGHPLRFLPGWSTVERLRGEVNALKHRSGFTLHYQDDSGYNIINAVHLSKALVAEYTRATHEWLLAAIRTVEGNDRSG